MGLVVGVVFGGFLFDLFGVVMEWFWFSVYDVFYVVSLIVMLGVLVYILLFIKEVLCFLNF